ncbi:hypothetical protein [Mucilaginibacter paludis]|uniref:Uncharacterized protein n=1 Tax=Mucilaginibacter paludis DSM 18603 TaxID=714943 RepID=H1YCD0_9SPHI|nr:hypothetical protein [Mucilaginibacter paludis]EHQ30121.1 hypothetical protein Mucpa_6063 [Mucilaginibacter paludis DSM 18603]
MNKKFIYLFCASILLSFNLFAQSTPDTLQGSLDVHFNALGFMDNREYSAFVPRSRTYSGTRTTLDFGINLDSLNHFIVGVNGIHEFGAQPYFLKVDPIAYYHYESNKWTFNIGQFPREGLLTQYPRALLNDTLRYYRPNVEGLLTSLHTKYGYETIWIDWVSRQTATDREQFLFGDCGTYTPNPKGPFYLSHYFLLLHDAGNSSTAPQPGISDNGAAQIRVGLDYSHRTVFDSLKFDVGGMLSLERTRGVDGFRVPKGFVASAFISYHKFALFEEFYGGQGSHVDYGDSFYEKSTYNRLDIIYSPFVFKHIKGQFIISIHSSPGYIGDSQQAFRLTYDLGRKVLKRFKTDNLL